MTHAAAPCTGIRVLDLSTMVSGPFCGQLLGDLGADVVKLEPLHGDILRTMRPAVQGASAIFTHVNRNKRSIAVDLKAPRGLALARKLADGVDVLIENFRPGVAARLGLGYEQLRDTNPGLVYLSVNGFGETGPYADQPAYDLVIQGLLGFMPVQGRGGSPVAVKCAIADKVASLSAALAVLAALRARDTGGGGGQMVNVRMLDAFAAFMLPDLMANHTFLETGAEPLPTPDVYQGMATADGHVIGLIMLDHQFAGICTGLGRGDLRGDPRFADASLRIRNIEALHDELRDDAGRLTTAAFMAMARANGLPFAPVNDIDGFLADPQVAHNDAVVEVEDPNLGRMRQLGFFAAFAGTPLTGRRRAPLRGEHTDEILRESGYDEAEIGALRRAAVIA